MGGGEREGEDPNYVVKIEKAIAEKYGEEAIQNPKKTWNEDKEQEYFKQLKEFYREQRQEEDYDKKEVNGVLIPRKLLNSDSNRSCPVCSTYTTKAKDDLYFTKFNCCFKCYVQWIEDREERWKSGWRPNNETNNKND
jgi:hypothetical protein